MTRPRRHKQYLGAAPAASERRAGPSGQIRQGQRGVARLGARIQKGGPYDQEKEKKDLRQRRRGGLRVAGGYYHAPGLRNDHTLMGRCSNILGMRMTIWVADYWDWSHNYEP